MTFTSSNIFKSILSNNTTTMASNVWLIHIYKRNYYNGKYENLETDSNSMQYKIRHTKIKIEKEDWISH